MKEVPILIVGGGCAGLSTSMLLSSYGVDSLLVSALPSTSTLPKAHVLGQRTMEIFAELGVADEIRRRGTPPENMVHTGFYAGVTGTHRHAGREIGKVELWGAGYRDPEYVDASPCPTANLPQLRLEPILKERAEQLQPGGVCFNHELVALEQDADGVLSTVLDRSTGEHYQVRSRYLIGADGGRTVGTLVGVDYQGERNILDMVTVHMSADLSEVLEDDSVLLRWLTNPTFGGTFMGGVLNPMGPEHWGTRSEEWVFSIGYPSGDPDAGDRDKVLAQMKALLGMPDLEPEIHTISVWRMEAIIADSMRTGRVLLIGDAAHKHPPTSGLGLNSAVHDAQNVCWKLAEVLAGRAGDALLDTYEAERRPVVERNIANSVKCTQDTFAFDAALGLDPERSAAENWDQLEIIWDSSHPEHLERVDRMNDALAAKAWEFRHHGLEFGYTYRSDAVVEDGTVDEPPRHEVCLYEPSTRPGHPLPHAFVVRRNERFPLQDLTHGGTFLLIAGEDGDAWVEAARKVARTTGVRLEAVTVGADGTDLIDQRFAWLRKREITREGAILVRPDRFVAFRAPGPVEDPATMLDSALVQILATDGTGGTQ